MEQNDVMGGIGKSLVDFDWRSFHIPQLSRNLLPRGAHSFPVEITANEALDARCCEVVCGLHYRCNALVRYIGLLSGMRP